MRREPRVAAFFVLLLLLLTVLYPALALNHRVAPEGSLRSVAPWRLRWGPNPAPSPIALHAATHLGPRLESMSRHGLDVALWNPWIGGGRGGWLGSPQEGGAPLSLVAGLLARPEWTWSSLVALTVAASFVSCWMVVRRLGASPWAAALGALVYTLSGAVVTHWFDWSASALALGPLALLPALLARPHWALVVATWTGSLLLLVSAGPPAGQFLALALAYSVLLDRRRASRQGRWSALAFALLLVVAMRLPSDTLAVVVGEPGAAPERQATVPAPAVLRGFLEPFPAGDPVVGATAADPLSAGGAAGSAYLGAVTLLLAAVGLVRLPARPRGFCLGVIGGATALVLLPSSVLSAASVPIRPFGVLALLGAVLAALGADGVLARLPARYRTASGIALCVLAALQLAPPALHRIPYSAAGEARLALPVDPELCADGSRVVALLSTMPADVGAGLGLADVRAAWFSDEPTYSATLGADSRGELSVSRGLSPRVASLGARWVLEPLPLRVVSAEAFSRIESGLAPRTVGEGARAVQYDLSIPAGPCRLGIDARAGNTTGVLLQRNGRTRVLVEDSSLSYESAMWRWFSLGLPEGEHEAKLALVGDGPFPDLLPLAWDCSGLVQRQAGDGVRLWEWRAARPLLSLSDGAGGTGGDHGVDGGSVELLRLSPDAVHAQVHTPSESLLVVLVKHRPGLWRAQVDGVAADTETVDGLWTGVRVPSGESSVRLEARLPGVTWLLAALACIIAGLLAVVGRF